jgi:hypothetical protein
VHEAQQEHGWFFFFFFFFLCTVVRLIANYILSGRLQPVLATHLIVPVYAPSHGCISFRQETLPRCALGEGVDIVTGTSPPRVGYNMDPTAITRYTAGKLTTNDRIPIEQTKIGYYRRIMQHRCRESCAELCAGLCEENCPVSAVGIWTRTQPMYKYTVQAWERARARRHPACQSQSLLASRAV